MLKEVAEKPRRKMRTLRRLAVANVGVVNEPKTRPFLSIRQPGLPGSVVRRVVGVEGVLSYKIIDNGGKSGR